VIVGDASFAPPGNQPGWSCGFAPTANNGNGGQDNYFLRRADGPCKFEAIVIESQQVDSVYSDNGETTSLKFNPTQKRSRQHLSQCMA
jgi:hypothetical protein